MAKQKLYLNKRYKFKGWDYCEVAHALGVPEKTIQKWEDVFEDSPEDCPHQIAKILYSRMVWRDKKGGSWPNGEVEMCRKFLRKVDDNEKHIGYNRPAYEGILKIKDDETFMNWFCGNLGRMWT
jgi:hypothetical protein